MGFAFGPLQTFSKRADEIYQDAINRLRACLDSFNESSDNVIDIRDQTKRMAELKTKGGKIRMWPPYTLPTWSNARDGRAHQLGFWPD